MSSQPIPAPPQNATPSLRGLMSAADKTKLDAITGSQTGTNTGDVTLGVVGSSPNANGASLSGQVLTLQPADGSNPGSLTAGAQTIGGAKTFSSPIASSVATNNFVLSAASATWGLKFVTDKMQMFIAGARLFEIDATGAGQVNAAYNFAPMTNGNKTLGVPGFTWLAVLTNRIQDVNGNNRLDSTAAQRNEYTSDETDGASAVAHRFFTRNNLANAGAKVAAFFKDNLSTEVASISAAGAFTSGVASGSNAFVAATGARWKIGGGTTDYFISDGSATITCAGVLVGGNGQLRLSDGNTNGGLFSGSNMGINANAAGVRGGVANGASAIAAGVGNFPQLTTAGARLFNFYNDSFTTLVASVDKDGAIQLNMNGGTRPSAAAAERGKIWYTKAAGGVADKLEICLKDAADAYSWVQIKP